MQPNRQLADSRRGDGPPPGKKALARSLAPGGWAVIWATGAPLWPDGARITATGRPCGSGCPAGDRMAERLELDLEQLDRGHNQTFLNEPRGSNRRLRVVLAGDAGLRNPLSPY